MKPYVSDAFKLAHENGETHFTNYDTVASFAVYGQLGILLDTTLSGTERVEQIRAFLNYLLYWRVKSFWQAIDKILERNKKLM